jgi:uncharacterized protein
MVEHALYIPAGLFVGVLVGLTGVGGGALMTPILVLLFGQSPAVAVGTDLVFAATTKLAATASFGYSRKVDWRIVGRLALGSLPAAAAVLTFLLLTKVRTGETDQLVERSLSIMLIVTAVGLLAQGPLRKLGLRATAAWLKVVDRWTFGITIAMGVVIGAAVTLTSVGAGALGVVGLLYLYPLRLTADRLVATDIAHALPLALIAGLGHATLGHLDLTVLAYLLLGSIPGVLIASRLAIRLPQSVVRRAIAIVLGGAGFRLLLAA